MVSARPDRKHSPERSVMEKISRHAKHGKSDSGSPRWYEIEHLIAGLDASVFVKYLLCLTHLHTNNKTGRAWTSQTVLAREMSCSLISVNRAFRQAVKMGVLEVERIRTGKHSDDQYNEYWLNVDHLRKLTRHNDASSGSTTHPTDVCSNTSTRPTDACSEPTTRLTDFEHTSHRRLTTRLTDVQGSTNTSYGASRFATGGGSARSKVTAGTKHASDLVSEEVVVGGASSEAPAETETAPATTALSISNQIQNRIEILPQDDLADLIPRDAKPGYRHKLQVALDALGQILKQKGQPFYQDMVISQLAAYYEANPKNDPLKLLQDRIVNRRDWFKVEELSKADKRSKESAESVARVFGITPP